MKINYKIICLILALFVVIDITGCSPEHTTYQLDSTIVGFNKYDDMYYCIDYIGNGWEFKSSKELEVGDIVTLNISDNGTPTVSDDDVVIGYTKK